MSYLNTYYEILNLSENASIEEIEESFHKLKIKYENDESNEDNAKLVQLAYAEIMNHKKIHPNDQRRRLNASFNVADKKDEILSQNNAKSTGNKPTSNEPSAPNVKNLVNIFQTQHPNTQPNDNLSNRKSIRTKSTSTSGSDSKIQNNSNVATKPHLKNVDDVVRPPNLTLGEAQNRDSSNQNPKTTSTSANNLTGKEQPQSLNFSETKSNEQDNVQEQLNELNIENIHIIDNETVNLNEAQKLEKETIHESKAESKTAMNPEPKNPVEQKRKPATSQNNKKTPTPFVRQRKIVPKCPPLEQEVHLTLEEVFNGGTKTVNVIRKMEMIGKVLDDSKDFPIVFSPGVETDTRFDFPQEGNKSIKLLPGDLVLIIKDKPEQYFKRINQCDVEYTARVLQKNDNANDVHQIDVPMFDNQPLVINIKENEINGNTFHRILGRGLPRKGDAKFRGDLLVRFELVDTLDDVEVKQKINHGKQIKENTTIGKEKSDSGFKNSQIENQTQNGTEKKVKSQKPKRPVTRFDLELSLNEILKGCKKSATVDIKRSNRGVTNNVESKTFDFDIKPGIPTGFEFTFEGRGDQLKDGTSADVVFTVVDKHHPYFTRYGSEIRYVAKASPSQFKNNVIVEIPTLENNTLKVKLDKEFELSMEKRFFGRGLPYPNDTKMRGGLLVQFKMVSEEEANELSIQIKNKIVENRNEENNKNVLKDTSFNPQATKQQLKLSPNEYEILLSLEEIYRGCLKRMKIKRKIVNENKTQNEEDAYLEVSIPAGSVEGTKITIEKGGDKEYDKISADAIFTVREETHSLFKRDGLDIIYAANITSREAILGCTLKIPTLDNQMIPLTTNGGITPETVRKILNAGLSDLNDNNKRGNLLVHFKILFGQDASPTPTIEYDLPLSLLQILNGAIVKKIFTRKVINGNKDGKTEDKTVNIDVKPGTKSGTRFVFPREGDQEPGKIPADVVFIAHDELHNVFIRNGANLEYTAKITQAQLGIGGQIEIPTLENAIKSLFIDDIKEGSIKKLSKFGLPHSNDPNKRGDILVKFEIIPEKPKIKDPDVEYPLPLTLENVFNGCTKRLKINRRIYKNGKEEFVDKVVVIDVKPGTIEGTTCRFAEYGDENPDSIPSDVVFIARDKPNAYFKRDGANIIYHAMITKSENFNGLELEIPTLEKDKSFPIFVKDLSKENSTRVFNGQGLPIDENMTRRGNLIVNFEVVYNDRKDPDKEIPLSLSLENILFGFSKQIEISRKNYDSNGTETIETKMIPLDIKPGMEAGRRVTLYRQGDRRPGCIPGDLIFIISDIPHKIFARKGANLKYVAKVTSSQIGHPCKLEIPLLDNEPTVLEIPRLSKYSWRKIIGKGLPYFYSPNMRGDIDVEVEVIDEKIASQNTSATSNTQISQKPEILNEKYQRQSSNEVIADKSNENLINNKYANLLGPKTDSHKQLKTLILDQPKIMSQIKVDPFHCEIEITLEEILNGGIKIVHYQRKITDEFGNETFEDADIELNIPAGVEAKHEFKFEEKGNRSWNKIPGDVIVAIKEIQHKHFKRTGVDLIYTVKISNFESLMGFERQIPTLNDNSFIPLKLEHNDPVNSKSVKILHGYGLPHLEQPDKLGNIVVNFEINGQNTEDSTDNSNKLEKETKSQNPPIHQVLELSLENILHGYKENIDIHVKVDDNKIIKHLNKTLALDIKPGIETGEKIVIKNQGHQFPDKTPSDVIFVIKEKPHDKFVRDGVNIEYIAQITSKQISDGGQILVPTLTNNETIPINLHKQIDPETAIKISDRGLPFPDNPDKRGDLIIRFEILDADKEINTGNKKSLTKVLPKEIDLWLTLDEVFKGCTKHQKIERIERNSKGIAKHKSKKFEINIAPGTKTGEKFYFKGEGDQHPGKIPGDVVFVVRDQKHSFFKRNGANIEHTATISSSQASKGKFVQKVPTLQKPSLLYQIKEKITKETVYEIDNEGLPLPNDHSKRGKMILNFYIVEDGSSKPEFKYNFTKISNV